MPGTTLASLDAILKTQYLGPIREQLNNASVVYSRLERNEDSVVGKNFTIPLHYGRNEGIGARAEGAPLPNAGHQSYKECIVPMRYLYGRIKLTGPTIKAARNNKGAFVRAVESEMRGLEKDMKASMNRQAFGDGSGILTACGVTNASTTVVVASTAKLRVGMPIDILLASDGTAVAAGREVVAVLSATTFTISGAAVTTTANHAVYVAGSRNIEMMGLGGIVSDADPASGGLQTLTVSANPWWKASVLGNSGTARAISDILMQTAIDTVEQKSSGKVSAIYTSYGVRRAYQAMLTATKQLVNTMDLAGGFKAISYNDLPLIPDKDAPAGKIFFVDEKEIQLYRLGDFDWMDEDGSILSRVSGEDAYEAVLFAYQELGTSMRNAHALLTDITEA